MIALSLVIFHRIFVSFADKTSLLVQIFLKTSLL